MIYFDHAATTKPCQAAVEAAGQAMLSNWGNPSSLYEFGLRAEEILENTRRKAAALLGCNRWEIYFTSGGTEANALAVFGAAKAGRRRGKRIVTSAIEHASVLESMNELERQGFEVVRLKPGRDGNIDKEALESAITPDTILISLMLVNNETGAILPVRAAADAIKRVGAPALLHCDAVQAFGKLPVSVKGLGVDLLTASSHKINGPKGCGMLYKSTPARILPHTLGGEQEQGLRPGTEAVPAIAGFGAAMTQLNIQSSREKVKSLNKYLRDAVARAGFPINSPVDASEYILNFSVLGYRSEILLHALDMDGICVSSGSACAKGKKSHVLQAMGLTSLRLDSALRISLGPENTIDEVDLLMKTLQRCIKSLKSL